jgi:putative molybdopterin biosynthesis protein
MNSKRNIYLNLKSIEEAKAILFENFGHLSTETEVIDVVGAKGRVLAKPAIAAISSPNFHAAAMDGIAVDAANTFGAGDDSPLTLVPGKTAFWINTGHVLPPDTNAVIMIENLNILDEQSIEIEAPVFPWQHVRKMGEDIVATRILFSRGHKITSYSLGALLSGGIFRAEVYKKPKVLIIPTGSELRQWHEINFEEMKPIEMKPIIKPGEVIESNSSVLGGLCEDHGACFDCHSMLKDNLDNIQNAVETAAKQDYDMICIIGGSSAGSEDYAKPVISALGEILIHGVTMMPGKPVMLGKIFEKPVFGIPGYPVSAIVAFEQFAGPLLLNMQKQPEKEALTVNLAPSRKIASKLGQEEFLRVKIGSVDGKLIASQLPRGAGSITTLTEADGIIRIPADFEGIAENEPTVASLLKPLASIENTIVITGSHDNTLDVLADQIRMHKGEIGISSSHVGSMGGLMAIKKGSCHMAGAHLLDTEDGSYNISYIKKYLPDMKVRLINLVMREQGLIVPGGNPKGIKSIEDIKDKKLRFINRQGGSGTRILLDYKLKMLGLSPSDIQGYGDDEYTHMSVAVAVLSGRADVGLGIMAAAKALNLDFIPVVTEEYDLVIPEKFFLSEKVQVLLETIQSTEFKNRVLALGGYGTENTGMEVFRSENLEVRS